MKVSQSSTLSLVLLTATNSVMMMQRAAAFSARQVSSRAAASTRAISTTSLRFAEDGQAEVVLVGCGAPNRGASSIYSFDVCCCEMDAMVP